MSEESHYIIIQNYLQAELNEILNGTAIFIDIEDAEPYIDELLDV